MNTPTIALIVTVALFGLYGWLSGIECATALSRLFPKFVGPTNRARLFFTPLWEVTNVFLVFGFTAFAVFFNNALVPINTFVLPTISVGLVALLLRASLVLYIFYVKPQKRHRFATSIFLLASYTVPLSFAAVGIWLLTNQFFWQSWSGWLGMAAAGLALFAQAISFVAFQAGDDASQHLRRLSGYIAVLFAAASAIFGLFVFAHFPHLSQNYWLMYVVATAASAVVLCVLAVFNRDHWLWWYVSIIAIGAPILLALANLPYLSYPNLTVASAYGAAAYGDITLIALAATTPILLFGFGLLAVLMRKKRS